MSDPIIVGVPSEVSQPLREWVIKVIDLGIDHLRNGAVIIPFVFTPQGEKGTLNVFVSTIGNQEFSLDSNLAKTLDFKQCVALAKAHVRTLPLDVKMYAVVYPATVTLKDDREFNAVVAEVGERGQESGFRFGQAISVSESDRKVNRIHNINYMNKVQQLLK